MALRIGGGRQMPPMEEQLMPEETAPVEEPMPEDLMAGLPESLEEESEAAGNGEVDPMVAGYKGPEQGPFMCGNCSFYGRHGANTCAIVMGPIDEDGICNMFTSMGAGMEEVPEEEPMLEEAPLPEEQPEPEEASEEMA